MFDRIKRSIYTPDAVLRLFTRTTQMRLNNQTVILFHFCARGEEMFCCVENVWWSIQYHWTFRDYGTEWQKFIEVDRIEKIDPPHEVFYSHSIPIPWDTECYGHFPADDEYYAEGPMRSSGSYDCLKIRHLV